MDVRSQLDLLSELVYNPMRIIMPNETIPEFELLEYLISFRPSLSGVLDGMVHLVFHLNCVFFLAARKLT